MRTDRADRRTNRFSANENAVTSRDHTPRCFASFRVAAKRLVVDALLNLEGTDRFGGVGGFVNISRHRRNILVNGLGAFLFGNVCATQFSPFLIALLCHFVNAAFCYDTNFSCVQMPARYDPTQHQERFLAPVVTPFRADLVPRKSLAHAAERGNRHEYERE